MILGKARRAIEGNSATLHRFPQATIALGATDPPRKFAIGSIGGGAFGGFKLVAMAAL